MGVEAPQMNQGACESSLCVRGRWGIHAKSAWQNGSAMRFFVLRYSTVKNPIYDCAQGEEFNCLQFMPFFLYRETFYWRDKPHC